MVAFFFTLAEGSVGSFRASPPSYLGNWRGLRPAAIIAQVCKEDS